MRITACKVWISDDHVSTNRRIRGYAELDFDRAFRVTDLKIIEVEDRLLLSFPSRKITTRCLACGNKHALKDSYCPSCGRKLSPRRVHDEEGRSTLFADICHPSNPRFRRYVEGFVFAVYREELAASNRSGYVPSWPAPNHRLSSTPTAPIMRVRS